MGSQESASWKVACGGNGDVEMDVWSHKVCQNIRNESLMGPTKVGEISKKMQERRLIKWHGM